MQVKLRELRNEASYGNGCDRHFQSFLQRANFNFLCNMQGNWSFLGHSGFVQKRSHSPGVLSAWEPGNHPREMKIYLVPGMS